MKRLVEDERLRKCKVLNREQQEGEVKEGEERGGRER